jgi:hypothetical protein
MAKRKGKPTAKVHHAASGATATGARSDFDLHALAATVLAAESELKAGFVRQIWTISDMLGDGLAQSGMGVTRYTTEMAAALGRSESYIDKYLRLHRVPLDERAEASALGGFRAIWNHLFAGRPSAPSSTPSDQSTDDERSPSPAPEDSAPENTPASQSEPEAPPDKPAGDVTGNPEPTPYADLLAALEVTDVADALTRLTQMRQRENAALAEVERLQKEVERLNNEKDTLLLGAPIGALLRELQVKTTKEALVAVRRLKANVAA